VCRGPDGQKGKDAEAVRLRPGLQGRPSYDSVVEVREYHVGAVDMVADGDLTNDMLGDPELAQIADSSRRQTSSDGPVTSMLLIRSDTISPDEGILPATETRSGRMLHTRLSVTL
jgi:hypothetical protein